MIPTAILTSDWHLRLDTPKCRTDDFLKARNTKVDFIKQIQLKYDIPILNAADLLDKWNCPLELITWCNDNLPSNIITTIGQHEIPSHNLKLLKKSGIRTLESSNSIKLLKEKEVLKLVTKEVITFIHSFPYGTELKPLDENKYKTYNKYFKIIRHIALIHHFTYIGKTWPGNQAPQAEQLLKKLTGYDVILCGDNHKSFMVENNRRLLINPGSIFRLKADQENFKPRIYLLDIINNIVEPIYLPIEKNVISREHIEKNKKIELLSNKFVDCLKEDINIEHNFVDNIKIFLSKKKIHKKVENIIWESIEN